MAFTKLDSNFAGSSLLAQGGLELAGFWAVLLSKKDAAGEIHDSLPKLAHDCYTTKERVRELLAVLAAPDPDSRTPDHEGRRIEISREPRWCIHILNHDKYRSKDHTAAERMRRFRSRKSQSVTPVTPVTGVPSASASVVGEGESEGEKFNRAESAILDERRKLELELGTLLAKLAEHDNSRLMVPAWCRKVTSYQKGEKQVGGVADFRGRLSIERLEKSVEDAQWWLEKLDAGNIVGER